MVADEQDDDQPLSRPAPSHKIDLLHDAAAFDKVPRTGAELEPVVRKLVRLVQGPGSVPAELGSNAFDRCLVLSNELLEYRLVDDELEQGRDVLLGARRRLGVFQACLEPVSQKEQASKRVANDYGGPVQVQLLEGLWRAWMWVVWDVFGLST